MALKRILLGTDNFEKLRQNDCYYVDKTGMIADLLRNPTAVNLFTRPRRFGKSLNMSMLRHFFEIGTDKTLFEGLSIMEETELCKEHMGQYPVISLTLKDAAGGDFEEAKQRMWMPVKDQAIRFDSLQDSSKLSDRDKECMMNLSKGIGSLQDSLYQMSRILYQEYGKKVIILIDEYDVPLQKAVDYGYYRDMVRLISLLI